jgi:hypothetical protein
MEHIAFWSSLIMIIFREENKLRASDIRSLRICGPKREEVRGGWRKLHNRELCHVFLTRYY